MSSYTQISGTPGGTSSGKFWLDNSCDYLVVKVSPTESLYIKGVFERDNDVITYSGESWLYPSSGGSSYSYNPNDSGQVTITSELDAFSSLPGFRRLEVADVFPRYAFFALFALILVLIGFNVVRKRWIV